MPSTLRGRSVSVVLLMAVLSVLPAYGAWAHSGLIGSNPSRGSTVSALPSEIELRFNEKISDLAPALILRHADETVAVLEPRIEGTLLRADAPPQQLPDGSYQLVWRIVSRDGHPLNGVIPLRIGGDHAAATEAPSQAQAPSQSAMSTSTAIVVGAVPMVLLLVLLLRRRLTHSDTKEEQQ